LCLNCCGLNLRLYYPEFGELICQHDFICLQETKTDEVNSGGIYITPIKTSSSNLNNVDDTFTQNTNVLSFFIIVINLSKNNFGKLLINLCKGQNLFIMNGPVGSDSNIGDSGGIYITPIKTSSSNLNNVDDTFTQNTNLLSFFIIVINLYIFRYKKIFRGRINIYLWREISMQERLSLKIFRYLQKMIFQTETNIY
jgi:hypothetical protein